MNPTERSQFEKWLQDDSGLSSTLQDVVRGTKDVISTSIELFGAVTTVVGIADFILKVVAFFGRQPPDRLEQIAVMVQRIDFGLQGLATWNADAHWDNILDDLNDHPTS